MTVLTTLAVSSTIAVILVGLYTIARERGYRCDERRPRSPRDAIYGRREDDQSSSL